MASEPIPLRSLTLLLNYERMMGDARYEGVQLLDSSVANSSTRSGMLVCNAGGIITVPKSIKTQDVHIFALASETSSSTPTPIVAQIHPDASQAVKNLTFAQRETIYHQAHGHNGCSKAALLYDCFFSMCPPNQKLSIQLENEEPVIVEARNARFIICVIGDPLLVSYCSIVGNRDTEATGTRDMEEHVLLKIPNPKSNQHDFICDMTRMEFGEAGRGLWGESYFLGTMERYVESTNKVCNKLIVTGSQRAGLGGSEGGECVGTWAKTALARWNNRNKEGWCEHCAVGGNALMRCAGCKTKKVFYCCKEHQKAGWELHKRTCEKGQTTSSG